MKKKYIAGLIGIIVMVCIVTALVWRGKEDVQTTGEGKEKELITIGFSQVGAESDWRTANSISIKNTFTLEKGYDLIFEDAKQQQESQIMAIRSFIQQDVDYIIFAPVVESGWDTVLEEAKRAEIPVIVIDRMVDVKDESLYTAWVGSNFYLQAQKACAVLSKYVNLHEIPEVNIINIQGTPGSTAQIARTQALEEAAEANGWNLLAQESGEYTEARAYEIMTEMLKKYDDINFVYCENDNEAFGAIEAIQAAGKTVGPQGDIKVISFDATSGGLQKTLEGSILINMECNPLQGPEAENVIRQIESGKTPNKYHYVEEQIFIHGKDISQVECGGILYEVNEVTEEQLRGREY